MAKPQYTTNKGIRSVKYTINVKPWERDFIKNQAMLAGMETSQFVVMAVKGTKGIPPEYDRDGKGEFVKGVPFCLWAYEKDFEEITAKASESGMNRSKYIRCCVFAMK